MKPLFQGLLIAFIISILVITHEVNHKVVFMCHYSITYPRGGVRYFDDTCGKYQEGDSLQTSKIHNYIKN